jgi:hypothetical protein
MYGVVALVASALSGWKAAEIFLPLIPPNTRQEDDLEEHKKRWPWKVHQFWLNFVGSATGWVCLWFVIVKVWPYLSSDAEPSFGWGYAALALVAFLGVTGYLPYTLMKTAAVIGKLPGLSG